MLAVAAIFLTFRTFTMHLNDQANTVF